MNELGLQHSSDNHAFDRLADGELTEAERRELLTSLDSQPDGWRRCALALLKAQAWREQFRSRPSASAVAVIQPATRDRQSWTAALPVGLALAASALVAFSLGLFVSIKLPKANPPDYTTASTEQRGGKPLQSTAKQGSQALDGSFGERVVTLAVAGLSDKPKEIELPFSNAASADAVFREPEPQIIDELKRAGYGVTAHREFWPLRMRDGRTLIVPVDDVQAQFIDGDTY